MNHLVSPKRPFIGGPGRRALCRRPVQGDRNDQYRAKRPNAVEHEAGRTPPSQGGQHHAADIAFLRAINVGGHTVKMDRLRQIFESLDFQTSRRSSPAGMSCLRRRRWTQPRWRPESRRRCKRRWAIKSPRFSGPSGAGPHRGARGVPSSDLAAVHALNIAFLAAPLDAESVRKLMALQTEIDDFATHEREVYWLCRKKQSESTFLQCRPRKDPGQAVNPPRGQHGSEDGGEICYTRLDTPAKPAASCVRRPQCRPSMCSESFRSRLTRGRLHFLPAYRGTGAGSRQRTEPVL